MTISIQVSVNGAYKVPVTVQRGDGEAVTEVISGRGHEGPFVKSIPYYHGNADGDLIVTIGKEEQDNGEAEPVAEDAVEAAEVLDGDDAA